MKWWLPGPTKLARAGMCPPPEDADGGRSGRAGKPVARGLYGSCFTCCSRVAAIPLWAETGSHSSVIALWRATTVWPSAPQVRAWALLAVIYLQKRASSARAVDCACEEAPFVSASSIVKRAAARALASAWESARCRAAIRKALPTSLRPAHSVASSELSARPLTVGHASWSRARDGCASSPIASLKASALSDPPTSTARARAADDRHAAVASYSMKRRKPMPPCRCGSYTCIRYWSVRLVTLTMSHMLAADQRILNLG